MKGYRHNFDGDMVNEIIETRLLKLLNDTAEALAGANVGGYRAGIAYVFDKKSPPPAPEGGPPGVRTGTLRRSFRTRPAKGKGKKLVSVAGTDVEYAVFHEYGRGVPRRPFMEAGIKTAVPLVRRMIRKVGPDVRAAIRKRKGPPR